MGVLCHRVRWSGGQEWPGLTKPLRPPPSRAAKCLRAILFGTGILFLVRPLPRKRTLSLQVHRPCSRKSSTARFSRRTSLHADCHCPLVVAASRSRCGACLHTAGLRPVFTEGGQVRCLPRVHPSSGSDSNGG